MLMSLKLLGHSVHLKETVINWNPIHPVFMYVASIFFSSPVQPWCRPTYIFNIDRLFENSKCFTWIWGSLSVFHFIKLHKWFVVIWYTHIKEKTYSVVQYKEMNRHLLRMQSFSAWKLFSQWLIYFTFEVHFMCLIVEHFL
jgi:hypothetical protein